MSDITINLEYGMGKKLLTKGKLCNDDIVVTGAEANLQAKTGVTPLTSSQIIIPDEGYDGLSSVHISAMPKVAQATPTLSLEKDTGIVTAQVVQAAGYVSDGTTQGQFQLDLQAGVTVKPSAETKTAVPAYHYTTGAVEVAGDVNLIPENIVSGKTIFGVAGIATGNGLTEIGGAKVLGVSTNQSIDSYGELDISGVGYYGANIVLAITANFSKAAVWNSISGQCDYLYSDGTFHYTTCSYDDSVWAIDPDLYASSTIGNTFTLIFLEKTTLNLISFTVDGKTYQAEEDMTWYDWCNSDYNDDKLWSCLNIAYGVYSDDGVFHVTDGGSPVHGDDLIIANKVYGRGGDI